MNHQLLEQLIDEHRRGRLPRLERLWRYYRNPMHDDGSPRRHDAETSETSGASGGRRYHLAQEQGLPPRLTAPPTQAGDSDRPQRERVIENDIAWRIHTLVDFMFAKPVTIQSLAANTDRAAQLAQLLQAVFAVNGGVTFFQDLAQLGAIYGFVDVMLHVDAALASQLAAQRGSAPSLEAIAGAIRLDVVEAPRSIAVLHEDDYRQLDAYILHVRQATNRFETSPFLARVRDAVLRQTPAGRRVMVERTQVWTAEEYRSYRGTSEATGLRRRLVESGVNRLGRLPVVHIQNLPQPLFYEGLSEVEPLIPLQDELNTRLSDRANRVTLQCFKMYLGKGIDQFTRRPIGPGQMWATDNLDASIEAFGGDSANPSEEAHINEIRQAIDKCSGVPPIAAGLIQGKVGNLTSEAALRVVMMGLLAKTQKKRITYGAGLERLCELILHAADVYGLLPNEPEERKVRLDWPNPLPENEAQRLQNATVKLELGVPRTQVLYELGYSDVMSDV